MLLEIVILLFVLVLAGIIFRSLQENKQLKMKLLDAQQHIDSIRAQHEEQRLLSARLETEKLALIERIEQIKNDAQIKQDDLKEQLTLIGKNLIQEGSQKLQVDNEQRINEILKPFKEKLETFEKEVKENNAGDIKRFASMEAVVKALSEQHSKMHTTAQNLVDALRGEQKIQGDWGEMALERILETSGLEKNREYFLQSSYKDEDNNHLRPDVIIQLPDEKHLIIDSKVSLKAFEQFINEDDPVIRKAALTAHLHSIKTHIKQLGEKDYSHLPDLSSPDFVLMFIPLESSFALAIKEEPNLYQQAWEKKVVLVTPSTLLATLKTVASIWKQEKQNRHALDIADQAGKLYDKFVGFVQDLEKIGQKQQDAMTSYNQAWNKLVDGRGNLLNSAEKLKAMGAKAKKQLDKKHLLKEVEISEEKDSDHEEA